MLCNILTGYYAEKLAYSICSLYSYSNYINRRFLNMNNFMQLTLQKHS